MAERFLRGENLPGVETINASVSGYSPWQQAIYLQNEGLRYAPDVVVVAFVLNDATEKFELLRFGGAWEGWQLSRSFSSVDLVSRIVREVNRE